jgi:hypothetical protein
VFKFALRCQHSFANSPPIGTVPGDRSTWTRSMTGSKTRFLSNSGRSCFDGMGLCICTYQLQLPMKGSSCSTTCTMHCTLSRSQPIGNIADLVTLLTGC